MTAETKIGKMTEIIFIMLIIYCLFEMEFVTFFSYGTHVREVTHLPSSSRGDTITNSTSCSAGKFFLKKFLKINLKFNF